MKTRVQHTAQAHESRSQLYYRNDRKSFGPPSARPLLGSEAKYAAKNIARNNSVVVLPFLKFENYNSICTRALNGWMEGAEERMRPTSPTLQWHRRHQHRRRHRYTEWQWHCLPWHCRTEVDFCNEIKSPVSQTDAEYCICYLIIVFIWL